MKLLLSSTCLFLAGGFAVLLSACRPEAPKAYHLETAAESQELWTGVAVSRTGRIFVNYPRWTGAETIAVAELMPGGTPQPFPDTSWNSWTPAGSTHDHFVCVQSVYVDEEDFLWILDPANPMFRGVVEGGAKLVQVDLRTNHVVRVIHFDSTIAPPHSYLNDVRVDTRRQYAYLTDSGSGALVVVHLAGDAMRRVLYEHPSTRAEDTTLVVEGVRVRAKVHADGLALDPHGEYLYYQALTATRLHRINARWLQDFSLSEAQLAGHVEFVAATGFADGLAFDAAGNLYLTSLAHNAIRRYTPAGKIETVVQGPELKWPDSIAITATSELFVTTSQLHLGARRTEPYRIFRVRLAD